MARAYSGRSRASAQARREGIAEGLGWFSVGLGLAQLFAPRAVSRIVGVPAAPAFMRLCGLREIACGIGILTSRQPLPWVQARVAGDALDLAALAGSAILASSSGSRIAVAMSAAGAVTALDVYCSRALAEADAKVPRHTMTVIVVNRPADVLYRYWRDFENLPQIMPHIESVQPLGEDVYHWVALGPAGTRLEWDSEIIDDVPNRRMAWRSLDGSDIFNAGSVSFEAVPGVRGTLVSVELLYEPPPGSLSTTVAKLFGKDPAANVRADLHAFKALMESGAGAASGSSLERGTGSDLLDRSVRRP